MSRMPITTGPLAVPGVTVRRSGIRWLREEGARCRQGEPVAFCNIGLFSSAGRRPFGAEWRDLQVAFVAPAAGRLRRIEGVSAGGNLDRMEYVQPWQAGTVLGHLDYAAGPPPGPARLLMLAGRRVTELAEVRTGLLTGWHGQARAWWGEGGTFGTLLGLGTCEQAGILRGAGGAFAEMFEAVQGPAQVVFVPDDTLVPCARTLLEQMQRTDAQGQAIAADMLQTAAPATGADLVFLGALLTSLLANPLASRFDILTRQALADTGPPQAVLLSVDAELRDVLRHRRLGYTMALHDFRMRELSPAVAAWCRTQFEPVRRSTADIQADYLALLAAVRAQTGAQTLVLNKPATAPFQAVQSYAGLPPPLDATLSDIRDQDLNLMLHDLEHQAGLALIDVDRMAAGLGAQVHIPDRIHQSGALQNEVRAELLHVLRRLRVPGFGPLLN